MSFALRPTDGRVRLLGPAPAADSFSEKAGSIQGALQAVQEHAAVIRKETAVLAAAQGRKAGMNSAQHMNQVASVSRATIAEARRLLGALREAGAGGSPRGATEEKSLQELTFRKLSEAIEAAAEELEKRVSEYKAAEAAWASRQPHLAEGAVVAEGDDLEAGRQQLAQEAHVAQGAVDLHAVIAEEYARDVVGLANNVRGMHRIMVDLAEHVQQQGEALTTIEANMTEVQDNSAKATVELIKTDQAQWRGLKLFGGLLTTVAVASTVAVATVWY